MFDVAVLDFLKCNEGSHTFHDIRSTVKIDPDEFRDKYGTYPTNSVYRKKLRKLVGNGVLKTTTDEHVLYSYDESTVSDEHRKQLDSLKFDRDYPDDFEDLDEEDELDDLLDYVERLENDSFECWSESSTNGYLTACISIKEKIKELKAKRER